MAEVEGSGGRGTTVKVGGLGSGAGDGEAAAVREALVPLCGRGSKCFAEGAKRSLKKRRSASSGESRLLSAPVWKLRSIAVTLLWKSLRSSCDPLYPARMLEQCSHFEGS